MVRRVLCVDPDDAVRDDTVETLQDELGGPEFEFETAGTLSEAEPLLARDTAALVTEYELPDGTGLDLIRAARDACPDAGCVLYTDTDPDRIDTTGLRGTLTEYVGKGSVFGTDRLAELLRTTVERGAQRTYPVPQDEPERLVALEGYDLDDPDLVASLDRVTDLAATHFGVDIASVNIIGEHSQEFLSCYGDAENWASMDREDSICTFTIVEDEGVMVVEDVTEDPRFESRSDELLELGIHAYMGASLVTPGGLVIGSLCVYDDQPRSFSDADRSYLQDLAAVAMDLVEAYSRLDAATVGDNR